MKSSQATQTYLRLNDEKYYQIIFCSEALSEMPLTQQVVKTLEQQYYYKRRHRTVALGAYSNDWRHAILVYEAPEQLPDWSGVYSGKTINSVLHYHRNDSQPYFCPNEDMWLYQEELFRDCYYLVQQDRTVLELMIGAKEGKLPHILMLCYVASEMYGNPAHIEQLSEAWGKARTSVFKVSFRADYLMRYMKRNAAYKITPPPTRIRNQLILTRRI